MDGDRIVDPGSNPAFAEPLPNPVSLARANGVDMPDVVAAPHPCRSSDGSAGEEIVIMQRRFATRLRPCLQMPKLHRQHCTLNRIHAVVESFQHMAIPLGLSPVAQSPNAPCHLVVIGDNGAALAAGAEVLARIEAEASEVAETAGAAACVLGAVRLRRIFDDDKTVRAGDLENGIHGGNPSMQ